MNTICEDIRRRGVLVSDGAWGTFLAQRGWNPSEAPEVWNMTHPEVVEAIASSYIEAGSDIISTNSFGGSRIKLDAYELGSRTAEINEAAATISRKVAGPTKHVAASIGPTGKFLMMGDVSEEEMSEAFAIQLQALEQGGADACCIETQSDLDEARLAIKAAKDHTRLEVICTFTYNRGADGAYRTMMGVSPELMVEMALASGADIIGTNCSQGVEDMVSIVSELRRAAGAIPILVQPNAGMPELIDGEARYPDSAEKMASFVPALIEAGANIIGGCCGTGPAHIRALVSKVQRYTGLQF